MKKNIKYNLFGLFIFLLAFTSCDTAEQDVSPIISPDGKPMVAISTASDGSVIEGESITYTVSLDKTIDRAITFTPVIIGGTADDHDYEALEPVTIQPYTNSVDFTINLIDEDVNESSETLEIQLEIQGIAEKYLINPNAVIDPIQFNIIDQTKLFIEFSWAEDIDFDILTYSDTATYPATLWGTGGAGSGNPEHDSSIWLSDPTGDYYVCILDWWEGINWDYTFKLTHADGSVQTITGTFDGTTYPYSSFTGPASWGSPSAYKILKVVNDGTKFTVTKL